MEASIKLRAGYLESQLSSCPTMPGNIAPSVFEPSLYTLKPTCQASGPYHALRHQREKPAQQQQARIVTTKTSRTQTYHLNCFMRLHLTPRQTPVPRPPGPAKAPAPGSIPPAQAGPWDLQSPVRARSPSARVVLGEPQTGGLPVGFPLKPPKRDTLKTDTPVAPLQTSPSHQKESRLQTVPKGDVANVATKAMIVSAC